MFIRKQSKKGQTTLEYIILIVIILAALLTIQSYLKRGIQGRLRSSADDIGEQYGPTATSHTKVVGVYSVTNEVSTQNGEFSAFTTPEVKTVNDTYFTNNAEQVFVP